MLSTIRRNNICSDIIAEARRVNRAAKPWRASQRRRDRRSAVLCSLRAI